MARVSLILPALDEEPNIEKAVRGALDALEALTDGHEVIVVDDGSTDGTAAVTERLAAEHPQVRLVRHPVNRGYGAALRSGFEAAREPLVFFTDADNQFDVGELRDFLPLVERYDVAIGHRIDRDDTWLRAVVSWSYNALVRLLFRVPVKDVNCSFKLFRRPVVDALTIESDNFFVDTEIVVKVRRQGFRLVQRGVNHYPRAGGQTTVRPADVPRTFLELGRMWVRLHRREDGRARGVVAVPKAGSRR